ncbi:MAG: glycosyltransferase family 2 protein [Sphingobacteriia bacterium]|nr:MAG: glycosyltransferase family 2 protein [Sphingobacteriia bacterium]
MSSSVAIILVNWNSYDFTHDCICSLQKVNHDRFTIIVVDNGSMDGSGLKIKTEHENVVVLFSPENKGFTGGNNMGFDYALEQGFDYAMLLNNDTFVEPEFLAPLVHYLDANPQVGAVQPRIYFNHDRNLLWNGGNGFYPWIGWTYTSGENKLTQPKHLQIKNMDWITGCAFMVRTSILRKTGLLAPNMFIYSEDVDLSFRIRALGYGLTYVPDSIIYHVAGASNKKKEKGKEGFVNPIVHYLNQRNRIWVLKKYTPWYCVPTVLLFNIFYYTLIMGYFALRRRPKKFKAVVKSIRDGLTGSIKYA